MRRLPLILMLAAMLLACERHSPAWERMLHAESIVDLHPDSAKDILHPYIFNLSLL